MKKALPALLLLASVALAAPAQAQAPRDLVQRDVDVISRALPDRGAQLKPAAVDLDVKVIKTESGIEAWLVEDHSLPLITMKFSFQGGLINDPEDKPGVAKMVSVLLDEGAGDLKSQPFQEQLSNNAIVMGFTPGRDAFHGVLKTTTENKDLAFNLLALALAHPRFDNDAVERMRNAIMAENKDNLGDPAWLSARTFNGEVFEGHYYSLPGAGTLSSIPRITRRDLQDFVDAQFAQNLLKVVIVGDVTEDGAREMLQKIFGELPDHGQLVTADEAKLANPGKTILLPLDTPQTYVAIANPGVTRGSDDWYAAEVMAYILGGDGFDSRLMSEVRKKRGLTYGVYSSLMSQKYAHVLQTTLSCTAGKTQEAVDTIKAEYARLAKDGVTADELANAKSYLIGSLPLDLTTTSDIANVLADLQMDNLPPEYLTDRTAKLQAVTAAQVQAMAQKMLDPANMTTVLVGQAENINVDILLDAAPGLGPQPGDN